MSEVENTSSDHFDNLVTEIRRLSDVVETDLTVNLPKTLSIQERLSYLRNKEEQLIDDLTTLQNDLLTKADLVEKTDLILNILSYKVFETQYDFRRKIDELNAKKEQYETRSISESGASQTALELINIDNEVEKLEQSHLAQIQDVNEQKLEMQSSYENAVDFMDKNFDALKTKFDDLLLLVYQDDLNEPQPDVIENMLPIINKYKNIISDFAELQKTGWKTLTVESKISTKLEQAGLKISRSGLFFTNSGRLLTYEVAREQKLLDNISLSWNKIFPTKGMESAESDRPPKEESKHTSGHTSSRSSSKSSGISRQEVEYLKVNLGKPLTLALAEITAVQPRDPIHYLSHWLFRYRYNQEMQLVEKAEVDALTEERGRIVKETWHKYLEGEAREVLLDLIVRADKEVTMKELKRIEFELLQTEEGNLEDEG